MRVGLADAQLLGAQGELEIVGQAQAAHVGIAVGNHAEGVVIGEKFQGGLHVRENLHLVARIEKHLRSEEHTSELQSLMRISYAVFCLKTKKNKNKTQTT